MSVQSINLNSYGLTNAIQRVFPAPIVSLRAPTTADKAQIGTLWVLTTTNAAYIITSIVNNSATWILLEVGGGAGVFASLTVTPGPISLTGTTTINTTGAASTTIGTGGTGSVSIGNATGNTTITGTVVSSGTISVTAGSLSAGNIAASTAGTTVQMLKSRGAAALNSGDTIGTLLFAGFDGVAYVSSSAIISVSSGTVSIGRIASDLEFFTHPDSVVAAVQRMVINPIGNVIINAPDSGVGLTVSGGGATITAGNLLVTAGNITATNGNLVLSTATNKIILPGPVNIMTGAGVPANGLAVNVGDMYINTTAASATTRIYVATAANTWTNVTCAA